MSKFNLTEGALCLLEDTIERKDSVEQNADSILASGTPVKIVKIEEIHCPSKIDGECHAPCEGCSCPYVVTVEDSEKKQWAIKCVQDEDGETSPLVVLTKERGDYLLSKKGLKQYKLCKLTVDGFSVKYQGPSNLLLGLALCVLFFKLPYGVLSWCSLIAGCLIAIYGLVIFLAGIIYKRNPLSLVERKFFAFYRENKEALEKLLKQN